MESTQGLLYVTTDVASETDLSPQLIVENAQKQVGIDGLPRATGSFVYQATDGASAGAGKPEWLVIWEIDDMSGHAADALGIAKEKNCEAQYRCDVFSAQATYSSPTFMRNELQSKSATNFIFAVVIRLDTNLKDEYNRYYNEEHIGALMKVPGWRRTRRFVELQGDESSAARSNEEIQILQLHDYDPENYGIEGKEFKSATSTPWYQKMMAEAVKAKDRRTYKLYGYVPC